MFFAAGQLARARFWLMLSVRAEENLEFNFIWIVCADPYHQAYFVVGQAYQAADRIGAEGGDKGF